MTTEYKKKSETELEIKVTKIDTEVVSLSDLRRQKEDLETQRKNVQEQYEKRSGDLDSGISILAERIEKAVELGIN